MASRANERFRGREGIVPQEQGRKLTILMADDDKEDCMLFSEALKESSLDHDLLCFANGRELLNYLKGCGDHEGVEVVLPDLIVLDLNMPVLDGRRALQEIKTDSELKKINVIVLTESREEADIKLCYGLGAESFLTKAEWFDVLLEVIKTSGGYWLRFVCPEIERERKVGSIQNQGQ